MPHSQTKHPEMSALAVTVFLRPVGEIGDIFVYGNRPEHRDTNKIPRENTTDT